MTTIELERPANEAARLAAVRRFEVLDTPADGAFDRITAMAARLLSVPIAIVSIVDHDRIWFKSRHGLPEVTEIGRDPGLCASAILDSRPWVVTDAAIDPRTLAPLDIDTVVKSVKKTGRLVLVDQAPRQSSAAVVIAGEVAEHGFDYLRAPIKMVTARMRRSPIVNRSRTMSCRTRTRSFKQCVR